MTIDTLEPRLAAAPTFPDGRQPPEALRRVLVDSRRAVAGYRMASVMAAKPSSTATCAPAPDDEAALVKPTFVRCSCRDLMDGRLEKLDPESVVLEIREASDGVAAGELDQDVLMMARSRGFKLAFGARLLQKEYSAFVPLASYIMLEMGVLELDRAASVARAIRSHTKATVCALQVRTASQFESLADAGVQMFEGLWYTRPPSKPDPAGDLSIQLSYSSLIKLLNLVAREAEINEIEELLKRQPTLAYQLLRHINTCGFGLKKEISSFRHAVLTVGQKRLFRWAALLMANTPVGSVAPAAGTLAIVRGRVMELLVGEALSPADADLAFVTGMFSMLDVLLGMPLEDALCLVDLPPSVTDAILANRGVFGPYLDIARACESVDDQLMEILSMRYRIPLDRMIGAHMEALAWAEKLGD